MNYISMLTRFLKRKKFNENRFESLIDSKVVIKGDLVYTGNMIINGTVEGTITSNNKEPTIFTSASEHTSSLIINGSVKGNITGDFIVINGDVDGDIHAGCKLFIKSKGKIAGNVTYKEIKIDEGAVITGTFNVIQELTKNDNNEIDYSMIAAELNDPIWPHTEREEKILSQNI